MQDPLVEVTIAVHSQSRPIARAVSSILDHTQAPVRVNVVAHNIDPELIRKNLGLYDGDPRLRLLALTDGIPSPAGPMNYGLANSTAPFVALLGSDDEFAPGAIDSWLHVQQETGAEMVLAKIKLATGRTDPYPPVRAGRRTRQLDPVRDRLAYRSAPLGLIDRRRFGKLQLAERVGSGEDLPFSLTIFWTGKHLAYDLTGPPYIVNADADDRVTSAARPLAEDFGFLDAVVTLPWFVAASSKTRIAIVSKIIRIHLYDAILFRARTDEELQRNRAELLAMVTRLEELAPGVRRLLSRADQAVLAELARTSSTAESLAAKLNARHKYLSFATLIPKSPLYVLHRQAPFRTLFAGYQLMRGQ